MNLEINDQVFLTVGDAPAVKGQVVDLRSGWVRIAGRGSVDAGPYACIYDEWFSLCAPQVQIKKVRGT